MRCTSSSRQSPLNSRRRDSVAPHGDKLHMLVPGHPVALPSLGAARRMTIRRKQPPRRSVHVDLEPGSLSRPSVASAMMAGSERRKPG